MKGRQMREEEGREVVREAGKRNDWKHHSNGLYSFLLKQKEKREWRTPKRRRGRKEEREGERGQKEESKEESFQKGGKKKGEGS